MPQVWLNGKFEDESTASISIRDTGLLHSAGLFTTMRAYNKKIFRLSAHLARLRNSCESLFVPLQYKDDALTSAITEVLGHNNLSDARLRLTVTRGSAQQDPLHGLHLTPTVLLTASTLDPYPEEYYRRGLTVIALDEQKLNPYDLQAGHKTLNYFSRLSALREANRRGAGEALWFNVHNYLQSGSISNVFIVKANEILTPPVAADIRESSDFPYPKSATLPGITRATIFDIARAEQISIRPAAITINDLLDADEVFLTNSIMGVMPVCRIERKPIAADKPGDMTRRLMDLYAAEVERA